MTDNHFTVFVENVETPTEAQALLSELRDRLKELTPELERLDLTNDGRPGLAVLVGAKTVLEVASVFLEFLKLHKTVKLQILTAENAKLAFDPLDVSAGISILRRAARLPGDPTIDPPKPR